MATPRSLTRVRSSLIAVLLFPPSVAPALDSASHYPQAMCQAYERCSSPPLTPPQPPQPPRPSLLPVLLFSLHVWQSQMK